MSDDPIDVEIDRNYDAFKEQLPEILPKHEGKFALMRNAKILDFFADLGTAMRAGAEKFEDGLYSVQEVNDRVVDLGFFSHAVDTRVA